jgi:thioredoxin reductase (NADPH)
MSDANSGANGVRNVVIVGSGCAGFTAALYTARGGLKPLVLEGGTIAPGGLLTTTTEVENFPGFPEGIMGPELMERMREQVTRFGTEFRHATVTKVETGSRPFKLHTDANEVIETRTLIVATGSSPRMLGLPGERELTGRGVSTCATCDGSFYKGKHVIVVGGGDSAMEEALYLAGLCAKVTLVHRRDSFRASKIMQERVFQNRRIDVRWDSAVSEILGVEKRDVEGAVIENLKTGARDTLAEPGMGIFVAIGHVPNSRFLEGAVETDAHGYIKVKEPGSETNVPGIFAAGDVMDPRYRQAVTAAGTGCRAAIDAERFLQIQGH